MSSALAAVEVPTSIEVAAGLAEQLVASSCPRSRARARRTTSCTTTACEPMSDFNQTMDDIAKGFEAVGVAVLVIGFTLGFVHAGLAMLRREAQAGVYRALRSFVGRTILLSLEILVAADLIRTVAVDPSIENVGSLALIVLIRTVLSFSIDVEIEGRLPWRSPPPASD
jgi:uncharacterized membrane protein